MQCYVCNPLKNKKSRKPAGPRWIASKTLARAFPGLVALWMALIGLAGALPAVFAVLVARLVTQLPAAVRGGFDSSAGDDLRWTLAAMGAVLLANAVASAARMLVQPELYRS